MVLQSRTILYSAPTKIATYDEDVLVGKFRSYNFTGAGVAVTDGGGGIADITIDGAGHDRAHNMDGGSDHNAETLGDLIYAGAAGAWTLLSGNTTTTRNFLRQTGDGAASAAPAWDTLVAGDIPDISATYVARTLFDAQTILAATSDDTPVALTVAEQRLVGRITSGNIAALTAAQVRTLINVADGSTAYADADAVSAVEAAGLTFDENIGITLDPVLSADGKWSGTVIAGTAGAALAFGDIVYFAVADSKWELTDADAAATAGPVWIGMCVLAAIEDAATTILLRGKLRADAVFPTLTIGAPAYVGLTAGDIVTTAPSATGDIVRIIGYGITANELMFCPDNTYVEIA